MVVCIIVCFQAALLEVHSYSATECCCCVSDVTTIVVERAVSLLACVVIYNVGFFSMDGSLDMLFRSTKDFVEGVW